MPIRNRGAHTYNSMLRASFLVEIGDAFSARRYRLKPLSNSVRGSGRFLECVYIRSRRNQAFETEFFNGACANCLSGSAARCDVGRFSKSSHQKSILTFDRNGLKPSQYFDS